MKNLLIVLSMTLLALAPIMPASEAHAAFKLPWQTDEETESETTEETILEEPDVVEVPVPDPVTTPAPVVEVVPEPVRVQVPNNVPTDFLGKVAQGSVAISLTRPSTEAEELTYNVNSGDNLWNLMRADLAKSGMSSTEVNTGIAKIVNSIRNQSTAVTTSMGIQSGNVDLIYPGDTISFWVGVN